MEAIFAHLLKPKYAYQFLKPLLTVHKLKVNLGNTNENRRRGLVEFNVVVFFRGLETQVGSMFTGWGIKEFTK